jgi:hypothetical protein
MHRDWLELQMPVMDSVSDLALSDKGVPFGLCKVWRDKERDGYKTCLKNGSECESIR